ncbi:hypothetical protein CHLNCDRAFT_144300 [Chlorella variabilis]|uniref:Uncharacterized protein n=1 Tax=Chlorella variabilis TaxID=554065 RepID=E1ZCD4_CHLVA|nr:hypothetical protein CHLNCDRAFT_144300 [Chlorella variabilis]EFN56798.1 hypothetical protein CHLNCDRAFT_144300 [Chlorella variabilis]|eukprot:XP_005848900.1 hypothetical protein CHLNCDRAFT_144300 [Chlorella variabilis]
MARVLVLMIACLLAASFPVRGRLILQAAPGPVTVTQPVRDAADTASGAVSGALNTAADAIRSALG